ncbi:MAG: hypothetical protein NT061_11270 [Spirochaetes bacterium]|nr:hypothetical protein [Spirochaetota bacterium]
MIDGMSKILLFLKIQDSAGLRAHERELPFSVQHDDSVRGVFNLYRFN